MTAIDEPETQVLDNRASGAPRLAPGVELMGQMEDSGFEETPYLARRADGKVIQLPGALYAVVEQIDGHSGYNEISQRVTQALGAEIEPDDARFLVDEKLAPLGLIDGSSPPPEPEQ